MDVKQYKCPNCDGELKFEPDKQMFCCEFCRSEFTAEQVNQMLSQKREKAADEQRQTQQKQAPEKTAEEKREAQQRAEFEENTRLYSCPSCGAEIVSDMNTAAAFCYYCHNPVILKGRVEGMYRPSKVLPFAFGRDKAVEYFNEWAKKKKFIPSDLVSSKQIEKMTGLYVPFWVADALTHTNMNAIGETVKHWTSGNYRYTQTKEFQVIREINVEYNGVPADGSRKIEDALMEAIEPFDYTKLKDFDMAYLSGFFADKFDVNKEEVYPRIHQRMFENNSSAVISSCGYSRLKNKSFSNDVMKLRWSYMLLPVWFMTFHYKGKVWEYAINGQTGKISGELPIDNKKLRRHSLLLTAIITAVVLAAGYLIGGLLL
ncbi:MAG: hypothetical protein IJ861_02315 [Clostridia bacterium]|nr:hypothetical protein [Clostridia bacterium]